MQRLVQYTCMGPWLCSCAGEKPRRGGLRVLQAPQDCHKDVVALQAAMLNADAMQRPNAAEVIEVLRRQL